MGKRMDGPRAVACRLAICLISCLCHAEGWAATESAGQVNRSTAEFAAEATTHPPTVAPAAATGSTLAHATSAPLPSTGTPLSPPSARPRTLRAPSVMTRSMAWNAARVGAVLALFGVWVFLQRMWLTRRQAGNGEGVVHVIGKVALDARQQLHFVRVGRRLLVLLQGPQGMQHVTEIDDPEEVEKVLAHWHPAPAGKSVAGSSRVTANLPAETTLGDDYRSFAEGVREGAFGLSLQDPTARRASRETGSTHAAASMPRSNSYFA